MAKRKTILVNPLDSLVPYPITLPTGESSAAVETQFVGPASVITRSPRPQSQPGVKDSHTPTLARQVAQPPAPVDLFSRIQSLEEQNEYIKWLAGGAILLAIML